MRRFLIAMAAVALIVPLQIGPAVGGHAPDFHGNNHSSADTIGISATPSGDGYHTLDAAGGVFTHGDARFFGSIPGLRQQGQQIGEADLVDLTSTSDGGGYWLLDHVGGVFTFGNARFFGSIPGLRQQGQQIGQARVVDLAPTHDGGGYYTLDQVGGVFTFGNAKFFGSIPGLRQQGQQIGRVDVVSVVPLPGGGGYWMLDSAGGVFTFGKAKFFGSLPGRGIAARVVGMAATPDGGGYWIATADGGVHPFGNARFFGSASGRFPGATATGFAASPHGTGYWIAFDTGQVVAFPGGKTESLTSRTFEGTGDRAIGGVSLKGGLVIATSSHSGESNFIVRLIDGNGDLVELIENEIGDVSGNQAAFNVPAGEYLLDVDADGSWSVNLDEPRPTSGTGLPVSRSGSRNSVIGPLQGGGAATVTYSYDGESNFIIRVLDGDGNLVDLVANEIGSTSGSSVANFDGVRFVEVTGDEGSWTVKVE